MAADAGAAPVDARLLGRPRAYGGNSQEWNAFVCLQVVHRSRGTSDACGYGSRRDPQWVFPRRRTTLAESVVSAATSLVLTSSATHDEAWRLLVRSEQPVSGANKIAVMQPILHGSPPIRAPVGPSVEDHGPSVDEPGPSADDHGPSVDDHGPSVDDHGPSADDSS